MKKYRIQFLNKPIGFYQNAIYEIEDINQERVLFKGYGNLFKLTEIIFKEVE